MTAPSKLATPADRKGLQSEWRSWKGAPLVRRLPDAPQARKLERRRERNGKHMNQRYTMNNATPTHLSRLSPPEYRVEP